MTERPEKTVYCPKCDKPFSSKFTRHAAMQKVEAHLKKAHPEYYPMYED